MTSPSAEIEILRAALAAREARLADVEAELESRDLSIEKLKHQLAGMQRHRFGVSSETLDQIELRSEDEEIGAAAERPVAEDLPALPEGLRACRSADRCRTISPARGTGSDARNGLRGVRRAISAGSATT